MKRNILAAMFSAAALSLFAVEPNQPDVIWDFKLADRIEFFQNNGLPKGVSYVKDGERNVFQFDGSLEGAQCAVRYLNVTEFKRTKGKTLRLSIKVRGENLKSQGGSVKFMLMVQCDSGKTDWPQANIPAGTYDWKDFSYT